MTIKITRKQEAALLTLRRGHDSINESRNKIQLTIIKRKPRTYQEKHQDKKPTEKRNSDGQQEQEQQQQQDKQQ